MFLKEDIGFKYFCCTAPILKLLMVFGRERERERDDCSKCFLCMENSDFVTAPTLKLLMVFQKVFLHEDLGFGSFIVFQMLFWHEDLGFGSLMVFQMVFFFA
jgi:hypothetical protein